MGKFGRYQPGRVEETIGCLDIVVRRLRRRLDRERGGSALDGGAEDSLLRAQIRDTSAAKREPTVESTAVRDVLTELRAEDGELREARGPNVFIEHMAIVSPAPSVGYASGAPA